MWVHLPEVLYIYIYIYIYIICARLSVEISMQIEGNTLKLAYNSSLSREIRLQIGLEIVLSEYFYKANKYLILMCHFCCINIQKIDHCNIDNFGVKSIVYFCFEIYRYLSFVPSTGREWHKPF